MNDREYKKEDFEDVAMKKYKIRKQHEQDLYEKGKEYVISETPIICIKDFKHRDEYNYRNIFMKDKFYKIFNIRTNDEFRFPDFTVTMSVKEYAGVYPPPTSIFYFNYYEFNEHFEMRSIYDVRKSKIKKVLGN